MIVNPRFHRGRNTQAQMDFAEVVKNESRGRYIILFNNLYMFYLDERAVFPGEYRLGIGKYKLSCTFCFPNFSAILCRNSDMV